jgi:SAM-dependent methyltransferase
MKRYNDYDAFAWLYNKEWYAYAGNIFPALQMIAGDKLPEKANILDVCCGTGQLAKTLIEKGYDVTGIDGSKEMLRYAKENAPEAKFLIKDARTFRLPRIYQAAFSTFDALNHITTLEELTNVFRNVFTCLVKGGIFVFDMTTKHHFETRMKAFSRATEKSDYLFTIQGDYHEETRTGQFHCTMFRPQGRLWKRSDTYLQQTWYPSQDIKSALTKAGFTNIRTHSFNEQREMIEATENSDRAFFYAQKP